MWIFGRPLSDYIAFAKVFLLLILATGIVRLSLSLGGAPNSTTRWFTMTALVWIGVFYYSVRVHTSGFGSFKELLVVCTLQNWIAQTIAVIGIAIAMITGTNNVFSSPEFAFGGDGKTWLHLGAHLVIGTTLGSLIPWGVGSPILALTRKRINLNSPSLEQS